jgi:hypothetical protein
MINFTIIHNFQHKHRQLTSTTWYDLSTNGFNVSQQPGHRGGGGMERNWQRKLWQSAESAQTTYNHLIFLLTFGFAWCSSDVGRTFLVVDYIASDDLGNLTRVSIIHHVDFTYVL